MHFRFSLRAEADLAAIATYIGREHPARAVTFVDEIREHCRGLITFPKSHRLRPELGEGVRLSVFGNYQVLYVVHADLLEIRRVVHGARDLTDID